VSGAFPSSRIGLGGGSLMGRTSRSDSLRIVGAALEAGIRHFDTARSYGMGESELALGRALAGRDDVTITTKVGLGRGRNPVGQSAVLALARRALALRGNPAPTARARPSAAGHSAPATNFDREHVLRSVDTSRRALRVDTIDCLLLHEVAAADIDERLEAVLKGLMHDGIVRRVGIATSRPGVDARVEGLDWVSVEQKSGGPFVPEGGQTRLISMRHSLLGPGGGWLRDFHQWLDADAGARSLIGASGVKMDDEESIAAAVFAYSAATQPASNFIIASSSPGRILRNVEAFVVPLEDGQLSVLAQVFSAYRSEALR